MKKLILGLAILGFSVSSYAVDGFQVYKKHCAACHLTKVPMEKMKKMEALVKAGKKPPIKAPPFTEVSARIKYFYPDKKDFVNFVVDYITNPSKEKAKCLPPALKLLGVMPPIGKNLNEQEKKAVAEWLYNNFNSKWEDFPMAKKHMNGEHHH